MTDAPMNNRFKLYTWSVSLYSARRAPISSSNTLTLTISRRKPEYDAEIRPAIGRWIIPVMTTPQGEIVQDGTDIIDWFEKQNMARLPAYPKTPRHLIASLIMEMFGGEGMLRQPCIIAGILMKIISTSSAAIRAVCLRNCRPENVAIWRFMRRRMRKAAVAFGVTPETAPEIEAAYHDTMAELDAHFAVHPYLLGGAPTIGDYGLFASLYAHLGRDPHPSA